jgi:hypothetical protein
MSPMAAPVGFAVRELPPEEWPRLLDLGDGLYAETGVLPVPAHNRILVIEDPTGGIVAYWGLFTVVHVEPVWIAPAHRQRISVVRRLWEGMRDLLTQLKIPGAVAIIADQDLPTNLPMAVKLGFQHVPGTLMYLNLDAPLYFPVKEP